MVAERESRYDLISGSLDRRRVAREYERTLNSRVCDFTIPAQAPEVASQVASSFEFSNLQKPVEAFLDEVVSCEEVRGIVFEKYTDDAKLWLSVVIFSLEKSKKISQWQGERPRVFISRINFVNLFPYHK